MSIIRLFFSATLSADMIDKLDKSQSHYLTKVMRIKENEVFSLFNKDGEWEAKVLEISKTFIDLSKLSSVTCQKSLCLSIKLLSQVYSN